MKCQTDTEYLRELEDTIAMLKKENKGLSKAYAEANEECLRLSMVLGSLGYDDNGQKIDGN